MIKEWQRFGLIKAYPDLKLIDYPKAGSFPKRNWNGMGFAQRKHSARALPREMPGRRARNRDGVPSR
jgi:hypothetical protein